MLRATLACGHPTHRSLGGPSPLVGYLANGIPSLSQIPSASLPRRLHSGRYHHHQWRSASRLKLAYSEDSIAEGVTLLELEKQLSAAVAQEDFKTAAALRDDIGRLRAISTLAVEKANAEFYQAFQSSDLKAMSEIWGQGNHVQCVHPSAGCIAGREEVMESWSLVLPTVNFQIRLKDVRVHATDSLGCVTCIEVMEGDDNRGRSVALLLADGPCEILSAGG